MTALGTRGDMVDARGTSPNAIVDRNRIQMHHVHIQGDAFDDLLSCDSFQELEVAAHFNQTAKT